jgi:hypothetical protein
MKTNISILFLILTLSLYSQSPVLRNFDFSKDSYKLIVYHEAFNTSYSESFYVSDISKLQLLKDNWIGDKTDTLYECGYDYYLYLIHSDSIVAEFNVNTECGQVFSKKWTLINFKGNPFQNLVKDGDAFRKHLSFSSLDTARITFARYKQNKNYFIIDPEGLEWVKFDGWFYVKVDSNYNRTQIEAEIEKLLKAQNADNQIRIILDEYRPDLFILKVFSKKEFYIQFNLGKKDDWNSYDDGYPSFDVIFTEI